MLRLFTFLGVLWFHEVHLREFSRSLLRVLSGLVGFLGNGIYLILFVPNFIFIYLTGDMVGDDAKHAILLTCLMMIGYEKAHHHM